MLALAWMSQQDSQDSAISRSYQLACSSSALVKVPTNLQTEAAQKPLGHHYVTGRTRYQICINFQQRLWMLMEQQSPGTVSKVVKSQQLTSGAQGTSLQAQDLLRLM